mgnify:CR=1 FL=1
MAEYIKESKITQTVEEELQDFLRVSENHTTPFYQFNSSYDGQIRSWKDYIDYSFKKFNQFVDIPEDTEDYEVHLSLPNVRNKMMAILARLSAQRMKSEIHAQNVDQKIDKVLSKYLRYFLEWSDEVSEQDVVNFYWMLETAMKGTGILCEDYFKYSKEIKDIKLYSPQTGKSDWRKKKIEKDGCYSFVIPLEEFYVWNMRLSAYEIEKQHKVYWKSSMELAEVKRVFKKYPKINDVMPGGMLAEEEKAFYNKFFTSMEKDSVDILRIWCPEKDSFKIIANNVELTEDENPIPFKHKKAPIVAAIYEPIVADFFPGKSLPDKCGNLADAIDQLFNDLFNRNKLQLKAPLTAKKGSTFVDSVWRPDTIIEYTGERPEPLQLKYDSQDTDRLYNILDGQLNLSTISPVNQGQVGSGSTAREVILAQENSNELMSMFMRFMEWGERKRANLRISNLLQFLTQPKIGMVAGDAADKFQKQYQEFKQYGVELSNGKRGTRIMRFKHNYQITPSKILEKQYSQEDVEIVEIPIELVQNLDLFIKIVPNSSVKVSDSLKKALNLEYTSTMVNLFSDIVNKQELASELTEDYDKSPDKMLIKQDGENPDKQLDERFDQMFGGAKPAAKTIAKPLPALSMNI